MAFYRERQIKSVRKARHCEGCGRMIMAGDTALDLAGHYEGDFWNATYHIECRKAEIALNDLHDVYPGEWINLSEIEWDDWPWLLEDHPVVAERMGVTQAKYDEIVESQRQMWLRRP